ncbi:unnamed protein product [Echinostoma caproni]|uniref:Ovule protein n=1 Tax=Echinostoma caproni TaxID=27848 RepID=A0A183AYW6_9TREM|nr:unnamed protein product [Echinostoma caproni]
MQEKEEKLMKASRFHRNSRSQSIPIPVLLGRRGSISLPEILDGMPSGQMSNRLSLVADELEESFKWVLGKSGVMHSKYFNDALNK